MRTSQFSEKQILDILKQVDAGQKVSEVCREQGISEGTYYRWKAKLLKLRVASGRSCGNLSC